MNSACRLESATSTSRLRDEGGNGAGGDFEDEFEEEGRALTSNGGAKVWSMDDGPFKLVLIVNMGLKMGKGKASKPGRTAIFLAIRTSRGGRFAGPSSLYFTYNLWVAYSAALLCTGR